MQTKPMSIPRAADRDAWNALAPAARDQILAAGEALTGGDYPSLPATAYMAFVRDGSRKVFETPYFARRKRLIQAVLAECVQHTGEYLDEVINGLWFICEESTWCVSAHNLSGEPLAEVDDPAIDLFAAQTASLLSWVCYLLEDALLPIVLRRVRREVDIRVIQPFFARDDFWWMGVVRQDLNNWTPWILANVLASAHIWDVDADDHARVILDRWLACIPEDGGLDEGAAYWNMAGGSLLDCLDHLGDDRYGEPKIRNLAAFPLHAHIAGDYYFNFADCDARPHLDGERVYTFGVRTRQPALQALGLSILARQDSIFPADTPEFYRVLCRLFTPLPAQQPALVEGDVTLPDLQIWVRRRESFYVALKGGNNAESHNHNDVGSFLVYVDGEPAIVDAGNMVYTAQTFREETRYTLWNTRSRNHNLPLIGEMEQAAGLTYRAQDVMLGADSASMDIAGAYPEAAGVQKLRREIALVQGGMDLTDTIALAAPQPVQWVFILRYAPQLEAGFITAHNVSIACDADLLAEVIAYPVEDDRMAHNYPGTLYRLSLTAPQASAHTRRFAIRRYTP